VITQALSVKQPWAALLLGGIKTIEVRRWSTGVRGRVLLHAGRIPDARPEAWRALPEQLRPLAQQRGGIIGALTLADCKAYHNRATFTADQGQHYNLPDWFQSPVMFGFRFINPVILPFQRCSGQVRFFPVEAAPLPEPYRSCNLLVSVRTASEVEPALAGGAGLIDIKDPQAGSLGRAGDSTISEVVAAVAGRRPISAALGELRQSVGRPLPSLLANLGYLKWGLSGYRGLELAWKMEISAELQRLRRDCPECRFAVVAYADWKRAAAPAVAEVVDFVCEEGAGGLLLDTWQKDGHTLLDYLSVKTIRSVVEQCRASGVEVALAGSLGLTEIQKLHATEPDWFAVRGAVCKGARRLDKVQANRVRLLVDYLKRSPISTEVGKQSRC
jgi:(5-formylfuran-3-yl)methyl phosphate synthase